MEVAWRRRHWVLGDENESESVDNSGCPHGFRIHYPGWHADMPNCGNVVLTVQSYMTVHGTTCRVLSPESWRAGESWDTREGSPLATRNSQFAFYTLNTYSTSIILVPVDLVS
jgi:hypothetical protein